MPILSDPFRASPPGVLSKPFTVTLSAADFGVPSPRSVPFRLRYARFLTILIALVLA